MKTSAVSRISASIPNGKKSKFNLSHDVNTSYDWGSTQPLFSKLMLPDSTANVKLEQLTRLAPMVVPTFGRVKMKNVAHFVPVQEIFPNWEAFMSQTKVSRSSIDSNGKPTVTTYVPKEVPHVTNALLALYTLAGSRMNLYISGAVGTYQEDIWTCYRNTGTWGTPAGASTTATFAGRNMLSSFFGLTNSATPSPSTIADLGYTGYTMNLRRLIYDAAGHIVITQSSAPVAELPTISTIVGVPMANAGGTGFTHSANNEDQAGNNAGSLGDTHISFDGADVIWEFAGSDPTAGISSADMANNSGTPVAGAAGDSSTSTMLTGRKLRVVFKLSSFGKRLRKILIGLGYDVNLSNLDQVSILPLVAFYKAWWDSYAPQRYKNFYETAAWKLMQACMQNGLSAALDANIMGTSNPTVTLFRQFMVELGTCFATEKMDVISAATDTYYGQTNTTTDSNYGYTDMQLKVIDEIDNLIRQGNLIDYNGGYNLGIGPDGSTNSTVGTTAQNTLTGGVANGAALVISPNDGSIHLTQPQINALKKAYIMINKSSVAGQKVEEILRALGYGDYVEECKGKFIQGSNDNIKISDVVSTAATADAKLGQYGGRGLGLSNLQFSFTAREHGYLIVLSAIVPEAGYINAPVVENEAYRFDKMYDPELDGLAFEAIQKKNLLGSPLINDTSYKATFGFLPTYSQWKFMSNKANGDFSLNSRRGYMRPFTLDKYLPVSDVHVYSTTDNSGSAVEHCNPTVRYSDLPNAGEDYRYVNKFPWNGDFNRIFSAEDDGIEWSVYSPNNNAFLFNSFEYDNFMVHNVFDVQYWAHMKSIEDSYGTYDEEHGAPNTSISKS